MPCWCLFCKYLLQHHHLSTTISFWLDGDHKKLPAKSKMLMPTIICWNYYHTPLSFFLGLYEQQDDCNFLGSLGTSQRIRIAEQDWAENLKLDNTLQLFIISITNLICYVWEHKRLLVSTFLWLVQQIFLLFLDVESKFIVKYCSKQLYYHRYLKIYQHLHSSSSMYAMLVSLL